MLIKPKGSPFNIFRHYATFSERKKSKISSFFKKLRILSLRYSADFRRSRLVILTQIQKVLEGVEKFGNVVFLHHLRNSKGPKGTALEYFRRCETFFEKKIPQRVPLQFFWSFPTERMLKNPKGSPFQFFRHFETFFQNFFFTKSAPPIFF